MIAKQQIFPLVLVVLDVAACIGYGWALDWRRSVYWFAAAVLTLMVTI